MKINMSSNSTSPESHKKMIKSWVEELLSEYCIPHHVDCAHYFLYNEGRDVFCEWLLKRKGLEVTCFSFSTNQAVLGTGFDFTENAALTKELLKL